MKSLTKKQDEQRKRYTVEVEEARDALEAALTSFNATVREAWGEVADCLQDLNDAIGAANDFRTEIHEHMDEYQQKRSEKWLNSPAGEAYERFRRGWEEDLDTVDLDEPESIEMPEVSAADAMNDWPLKAEDDEEE